MSPPLFYPVENMEAVDGNGVRGWVAALVSAIATVIISWLIDPVEQDKGGTVCIRDSGSGD